MIVQAAKHGDLAAIQQIEILPNVMMANKALQEAIKHGHMPIIYHLLDLGLKLCPQHLTLAAVYGQAEVVEYFLQQGLISHRALTEAAAAGHLSVVKLLVQAGYDIRANNQLALSQAIYRGHIDIVRYLCAQQPDLYIGCQLTLPTVARNHQAILQYLISIGADIHDKRELLLKYAAYLQNLELVNMLHRAGADISEIDSKIRTSAAIACYVRRQLWLASGRALRILAAKIYRHHYAFLPDIFTVPSDVYQLLLDTPCVSDFDAV